MAQEHMPYYTNDEIVAEMRAINDKWVRERTCECVGMSHDEHMYASEYTFELSCGHFYDTPYSDSPSYCPWCGAKVVS